MRIAFDQQVFLLQRYGGVSRYVCSLAAHLRAIDGVDARIIAPLHFNRTLDSLTGVPGKGRLLPVNTKLFRLAALAGKVLARGAIDRFRPDILHETYFSLDDYRPAGARRVVTVYDMIHERYANAIEGSRGTIGPKAAAVRRADHVICISENTRRDLIAMCDVPEEKTSVVHLAADAVFFGSGGQSAPAEPGLPPFLLFVGKRGGYKNFAGLVAALGASQRLRRELSIVCFGDAPLGGEELQAAAAAGLRPDQVQHRSGGDDILAALYRRAAALIYPSLYEGFGIPPLEAMAAGCPVLCSNTASLPEVVGDAGEYFDPDSVESITAALEAVVLSPARRAELVEKGRIRCRQFSWRRCAEKTLAVYRSLM